MLKSPPPHQQTRVLGSLPSNNRDGGGGGGSSNSSSGSCSNGSGVVQFQGNSSSGSVVGSRYSAAPNNPVPPHTPQHIHHQDASSCDADDEELPGDEVNARSLAGNSKFGGVEHDDDDVLDLSCKVKERDGDAGVKRDREDDEDHAGNKKIRVEKGKRRILRKKKRDLGAGSSALVSNRPSVISFAGAAHHDQDGSSSSSGDDFALSMSSGGGGSIAAGMRLYRRRRRRVLVREDVGGFDVDEHFRRSLGGVVWEQVVGVAAAGGGTEGARGAVNAEHLGNEVVGNGGSPGNTTTTTPEEGVRVIINDSIKASDVDDHFAKALGSETWSKIVASSSSTPPPPPRSVVSHSNQGQLPLAEQVRSSSTSSNTSSSSSNPTTTGLTTALTTTTTTVATTTPTAALSSRSSSPKLTLLPESPVMSSVQAQPAATIISTASSNYKIDAILGNNRTEEPEHGPLLSNEKQRNVV